jgi:hypothetical protein
MRAPQKKKKKKKKKNPPKTPKKTIGRKQVVIDGRAGIGDAKTVKIITCIMGES